MLCTIYETAKLGQMTPRPRQQHCSCTHHPIHMHQPIIASQLCSSISRAQKVAFYLVVRTTPGFYYHDCVHVLYTRELLLHCLCSCLSPVLYKPCHQCKLFLLYQLP